MADCCFGRNKIADSEQAEELVQADPTNGPLKNRSCTDVICGAVFLVFIAASALVGYFAYIYGDPLLLIYPTDSYGNLCGYGNKSSEPYLFYFDMVQCARMGAVSALVSNGCPTPQECVAECPNSYWVFAYGAGVEEASGGTPNQAEREKMKCKTDVDPWNKAKYKSTGMRTLVQENLCAPYYVESQPLAGRCIPSAFVQAANALGNLVTDIAGQEWDMVDKDNNTVTTSLMSEATTALAYFLSVAEVAQASVKDVETAWETIVVLIAVAVITSFLWIVLMRFIVGPMVYITFVAFILLFAVGCGFCFYRYYELINTNTTISTFTTDFEVYLSVKETWLAFGVVTGILLLIMLILMIFLRKRVAVAIAILQETSRALSHMASTLIWPIFPFIMEVAVFAYSLAVALYLASSTKTEYKYTDYNKNATENAFSNIPCDPNDNNSTASALCAFVKYGTNDYVIYLQLFNAFMFFWMLNFVIALGHMTLAGAFASYYWAWEKPKDLPWFPVLGSLWRCIRYHFGTLAFGSLIIAICQIIRLVLEYIDRKTKGSENPVAKFVLKCSKCCMACLERCLKYICKNAYIMTAIYGRSFCFAAKDAVALLMKNFVRAAVLDKVTDFILLVSKLVIVGAVGTFAYFFYAGQIPYISHYTPTNLNYFYVPVILIIISAFVIATLFFSVYEMGVDTIFLCFLEDLERHDGSPEKPFYMSSSLMEIIGEKNALPMQKKCD